MAAKDLGPITIPLVLAGNQYSASSVLLPAAGPWTFSFTVRSSEFVSTVADTVVTLY